jgi:small GTP-binding protein
MNVPDPESTDNRMQKVKLHLWDTGGQEQFRAMTNLYFRDSDAAIICYDISNAVSFESVNYWAGQMEQNCNRGDKNYVLALAGNKCDIDDARKQVTMQDSSELAKSLNSVFYETSAKSGQGVNELFMELIKRLIICIRNRDREHE